MERSFCHFKKVFEIFPELDTDVLCKLSEMVVISPSKVLKLVPNTSPAQLAEFLSVAEDSVSRRKIDRQEPPKVPKLAALENQGERISLLGDLKKLQVDTSVKAPKLACPTEEKSEFMDSLMKLIPPKNGGKQGSSVDFSEQFQSKILNLLEAAHPNKELGVEHFEQIYEKLRRDPMARSRLESLYAAKAYKYGHAHLGRKCWYKEAQNIATKLKSQADRRKFRMGLKGLIDFINQLNIMDLEKELEKGESEGFKLLKMPTSAPTETFCKYLEHVPPLKLIEFMNQQKAANIRKLVTKISSLAHFSQSMGDYFAFDDALEPALAVVCEMLGNTEDFVGGLGKPGTSFLSLAQPYEKHRSPGDHDAAEEKKSHKSRSSGRSKNFPSHLLGFPKGRM